MCARDRWLLSYGVQSERNHRFQARWGGLTTRTNNSTAALQMKQSHSGEKRPYLLRAWLLYHNTKSDRELSFLNSSLPLRFLPDMRVPFHSSQRLSSTTLNSLGSWPLSDAKELVVAVRPYPWCRPCTNQGQNKCKLQHPVSIQEPGRTLQDSNEFFSKQTCMPLPKTQVRCLVLSKQSLGHHWASMSEPHTL